MNYLYHRVRKVMEGDTIYPLNQLKDIYPNAYDEAVKKYAGREHVINQPIPGTDWLWNDVIHLAPIYPGKVKKALEEIGFTYDSPWTYFQVDPHLLEPEKTIVYLYKHTDSKFKLNPDNFVAYAPDDLEKYNHVPDETLAYFKRTFEQGGNPLLYVHIPHILYKGTISTKDLPIVQI